MEPGADLPPVSPELVALRVLMEVQWRAMKPAKRLEFQRHLADVLTDMEEAPIVLRGRDPVALQAAVSKSRAWIGRVMMEIMRRG